MRGVLHVVFGAAEHAARGPRGGDDLGLARVERDLREDRVDEHAERFSTRAAVTLHVRFVDRDRAASDTAPPSLLRAVTISTR